MKNFLLYDLNFYVDSSIISNVFGKAMNKLKYNFT